MAKPVFTPASKIADEEKYIEPVGRQGREVR